MTTQTSISYRQNHSKVLYYTRNTIFDSIQKTLILISCSYQKMVYVKAKFGFAKLMFS